MNHDTEKAIRQIPHELRRLTRIIATIGDALISTRLSHLKAELKYTQKILSNKGKEQGKSVVPKPKQTTTHKKREL